MFCVCHNGKLATLHVSKDISFTNVFLCCNYKDELGPTWTKFV